MSSNSPNNNPPPPRNTTHYNSGSQNRNQRNYNSNNPRRNYPNSNPPRTVVESTIESSNNHSEDKNVKPQEQINFDSNKIPPTKRNITQQNQIPKNTICRNILKLGSCPYGAQCKFDHSLDKLPENLRNKEKNQELPKTNANLSLKTDSSQKNPEKSRDDSKKDYQVSNDRRNYQNNYNNNNNNNSHRRRNENHKAPSLYTPPNARDQPQDKSNNSNKKDNNNNNVNSARVIIILRIETEDDGEIDLEYREGDDPQKVVNDFCVKHGYDEDFEEHLVSLIKKEIT